MPHNPKIQSMMHGPYLMVPFGTVGITILLEGWSFFQADPLVINQLFLAFLLSLPLWVALSLLLIPRFWSGKPHTHWGLWIFKWVGSTALAFMAALTVYMAWGVVLPYRTTLASSPHIDSQIAEYNYAHFGYGSYSRGKERRVAPGEEALDETLYDLAGNSVQLSDLWKERPIVVEFGSITCPVFTSKIPPMEILAREYSGRADFYVVYVREVHPGQNYPAHESFAQKLSHVADLRLLEGVDRTILVDGLDGTMHRDYGALPNSTYIIGKDGSISYRADWTDPEQLKSQLDRVLNQDGFAAHVSPMDVVDNFARPTRDLMVEIYWGLSRSGFAAVSDYLVAFPRMLLGRSESD